MKLRVFFATAVGTFALAGATASAATLYAAPNGVGPFPCAKSDPCSLLEATDDAGDGDEVIALPGVHDLGSDTIVLNSDINLHGVPGKKTIVRSTGEAIDDFLGDARVADLRIESSGGAALTSAFQSPTFERVQAFGATPGRACTAPIAPGRIRDSLCVNTGTGPALGVSAGSGSVLAWNFEILNVTAFSAGTGPGIEFDSGGHLSMSANITNTIAQGGGTASDVVTTNAGDGTVTANLDHVNYNSGSSTAGSTIHEVGGIQLAEPKFADATALNLHERPGSPTVDAGTVVPDLGPLDFERQPRAQGGAPDIGGDEFDHTLRLNVKARKHQNAKRLKVKVSCPREECTVFAKGKARAGGEGFPLERTKRHFLRRGEHRTLRLKPKHLHRLEHLLAGGTGRARITVKGTDAGGVTKRKRKTVELVG